MAKGRNLMLVVDGYNVLRSGYRYRAMADAAPNPDYADDAFNRAREALIDDVVTYAGRDYEAIIVFDGGRNEYSDGAAQRIGNVRIVFSRAGDSADKVIEKLAHDARERRIETVVVSSDAAIQGTVFGGCVTRMSANGFCNAVETNALEFELDQTPKVATKFTLAERIDDESRDDLVELRDNLGNV